MNKAARLNPRERRKNNVEQEPADKVISSSQACNGLGIPRSSQTYSFLREFGLAERKEREREGRRNAIHKFHNIFGILNIKEMQ